MDAKAEEEEMESEREREEELLKEKYHPPPAPPHISHLLTSLWLFHLPICPCSPSRLEEGVLVLV